MPKITEIFAFISIEKDLDDEGIIAWKIGDKWMPLVGADKERVDSLRQLAERTKKITGKKVTLAKFTRREDLEEI